MAKAKTIIDETEEVMHDVEVIAHDCQVLARDAAGCIHHAVSLPMMEHEVAEWMRDHKDTIAALATKGLSLIVNRI